MRAGQRICHALAQEGAHVAVMYARSRDQAESVAANWRRVIKSTPGFRL
jgi:NAD(P)-dependent dehydrogenase (short-subunit alcohol dehydrogenase family)